MVKRSMYQKIQTFKRQGLLKAEIGRKMELDPGTVAKYYEMSEADYREYSQKHMYRDKAFDKYRANILEVYRKNENKKLEMSAVFDYLEEKEGPLAGTEQTLRNYIRYLRETNQLTFSEEIRLYKKVPELPLGKQLQIDFGEYKTRSGLKLYIFAAVLSASRYKYVAFQDKAFTTLDLISHLVACFDYIGGMPEEIVIDQDGVMVVSENHGEIIYTKDFGYFIQEMDLKMYVCRKADPESKGKIENLIGYLKKNFLSVRDFKELCEAQQSLLRWLRRRANGKISQATKRMPADVIEEERTRLRSVRNSIYRKDSLIGREVRKVDEHARISVGSSQYSVPSGYKNRSVEIYTTDTQLFVFDRYTGDQIAEHELSLIPGARINKREHFRNNGRRTKEMRRDVLNMFALESWKLFVEANFKRYGRYVRDQCLMAQRRFQRNIDTGCLDQALNFCLEHGTLSMANLEDTYRYYKAVAETSEEDVLCNLEPQLKEVARYKRNIRVSKRDLGVYKSLVSILLGVWR
jgi:transposase